GLLALTALVIMIWAWNSFKPASPPALAKKAPVANTANRPAVPKPAALPEPKTTTPPANKTWTVTPRMAIPKPTAEDFPKGPDRKPAASVPEVGRLSITKLMLCQRVNGFGVYEPFPEYVFPIQDPPSILVYAEINKFKSVKQTNGHYAVSLSVELSLLDSSADQKEVWKDEPSPVTDECSSQRKDYYFAQYLSLPDNLAPGSYTLRVKLTDEADKVVAISSIPLTVTSGTH
ncbi:MAG: hypothetical protein V2A34_03255, partial [Lentisphaerota bacterium]